MKRHVDIGALYAALESRREADGRSWRDIAAELEISPSAFSRLAKGNGVELDTFVTLTDWLGLPQERFVSGDDPSRSASEGTLEVISSYLRADRSLKPKSAQAIETVLRAAYDQLSETATPTP